MARLSGSISPRGCSSARALVRDQGWQNVELVSGSVSDFEFPEGVGGIVAIGVLTYEPDFHMVVERGAKALSPGRRWVVLDYKMPSGWQRVFAPLFIALGSGFGVSREHMKRPIWGAVERYLHKTQLRELYGGFVCIVSGEAH